MMQSVRRFQRRYIDGKTVVSSALGAAALGGVLFVAAKSGVKPLRQAAKVAKGG